MQAGRELDALVAEKVMGIKLRGPRPADTLDSPIRPGMIFYDMPAEVPEPYSTDIAAAWQLVEKLDLMQIRHEGRWISGRFCEDGYLAGPSDGSCLVLDGSAYECAEAPTAPHAICLAALKAVGYEPGRAVPSRPRA